METCEGMFRTAARVEEEEGERGREMVACEILCVDQLAF
jgi:hypothetical protein